MTCEFFFAYYFQEIIDFIIKYRLNYNHKTYLKKTFRTEKFNFRLIKTGLRKIQNLNWKDQSSINILEIKFFSSPFKFMADKQSNKIIKHI